MLARWFIFPEHFGGTATAAWSRRNEVFHNQKGLLKYIRSSPAAATTTTLATTAAATTMATTTMATTTMATTTMAT